MLSKVNSMALEGLKGYLVEIQSDVSGGLPNFEIVGLPDIRVKEAKERVKTAIKNSGIEFPSRRIIVNLAPADKKKEGTFFDLAIALGILIAIEEISLHINLYETIFLGELSLDGKINKINGILPMCIEALNLGIKNVFIPKDNIKEALIIKKLNIIPVENLIDVLEYIKGERAYSNQDKSDEILFKNSNNYNVDFSEVKGQQNAKRALEIAAAGAHNCILIRGTWFGKNNAIRTFKYHFA